MTSSTSHTSPLPSQETALILHRQEKLLVPGTVVPLDGQNARRFADWDLEHWELRGTLEWYRRPFVHDLLHRQKSSPEKTFVVLTYLSDFPRLLTECLDQSPPFAPHPLSIQIQAALTVKISPAGGIVIYNIESAPWNKFGPEQRFFSLPAAALFFFAAQHHLATALPKRKFILSHPTDDGITFYEKKLQLRLLWSRGHDRYAVVEPDSLLEALLAYKENLKAMKQTLPLYRPD